MKQPWDWDEDDLLALITNGVKESIELDYKACDALAQTDGKKNEVSKDVSAFANSAGGTIVYGVLENGHVPVRLDYGYDPSVISKEWLDQVINSRIQRRIDGIRINQVELRKSNPGRVAYVVNVPQSMRAPHQAGDKRFYKRFNFESVAMEEYEVRDVARRSEAPDLRVEFRLSEKPAEVADGTQMGSAQVGLMPVIANDAGTPAEYVVIKLFIDSGLQIVAWTRELHQGGSAPFEAEGRQFTTACLQVNWGVAENMPVFQGVPFSVLDNPLRIAVPGPGQYLLGWHVFSPRMLPKAGAFFLDWNGRNAQIVGT